MRVVRGPRWGRERTARRLAARPVEGIVEGRAEGRHEMAVEVERGRYGGMTEARLYLLGVRSLLDQQGGASVAQVVEAKSCVDSRSLHGRLPVATAEVGAA